MKTLITVSVLAALLLLLPYCNPAKKTASVPVPAKLTYETNVQSIVMASCSPCHIPSKGGNKKAYDNFENVRMDIDEIIMRIEKQPGDRGFMPFKHPRLSNDTIAVFKQWRTDGLLKN